MKIVKGVVFFTINSKGSSSETEGEGEVGFGLSGGGIGVSIFEFIFEVDLNGILFVEGEVENE